MVARPSYELAPSAGPECGFSSVQLGRVVVPSCRGRLRRQRAAAQVVPSRSERSGGKAPWKAATLACRAAAQGTGGEEDNNNADEEGGTEAGADEEGEEEEPEPPSFTPPKRQEVVCLSFDAVVDATDEMCLVGFEAARRFWPGKIPGRGLHSSTFQLNLSRF